MKVVTITNQKGGVSKTTTALNMAIALGTTKHRVLAIDLDAQGNFTYSIRANIKGVSILEVLSKGATLKSAIQTCGVCQVIPSSRNLGSADLIINETGKEYRLKELLAEVADHYDYVIIDTPPALGILTINALTASDEVIIPAQADIYSMQGITQVVDSVQMVRRYCNPNIVIAGILLTRYNAQAVLSKEIADQLEKAASQFGTKVFKTRIRECIAIKEAQAKRIDIFRYDPKGNGSRDYRAFMSEYYYGDKHE